jgi:hypothetical protein
VEFRCVEPCDRNKNKYRIDLSQYAAVGMRLRTHSNITIKILFAALIMLSMVGSSGGDHCLNPGPAAASTPCIVSSQGEPTFIEGTLSGTQVTFEALMGCLCKIFTGIP